MEIHLPALAQIPGYVTGTFAPTYVPQLVKQPLYSGQYNIDVHIQLKFILETCEFS